MVMNFSFDICALFILIVVLIFNYTKQYTPVLQNKLFIAILWTITVTTAFEVLSGLYDVYYKNIPIQLGYIINLIYFVSLNLIPCLYTFYCFALTDSMERYNKKRQILHSVIAILPYALSLSIIILTMVFRDNYVFAFYIDETGYHRGTKWFYALYAIAAGYFTFTFLYLLKRIKTFGVVNFLLVSSFISFSVVAVLIQLIFKNQLIQCFGISYSLLLFSLSIQRPDERIDSATKVFNQNAFSTVTEKLFKHETEFYCAGIMIENIPYLINTFGIKNFNKLLNKIAQKLKNETQAHKETNKGLIFYISQGQFCIVLANTSLMDVKNLISRISTLLQLEWIIKSENKELKIKITARSCLITCPKAAQNTEEILDEINYVAKAEKFKHGITYVNENIDKDSKKRVATIDFILRNAFKKRDETLDVYYQPIYSVAKKRVIGAEALIRMRDLEGILAPGNPNRKGDFISPEEFIPIAEKNGTIYTIGEYVLEKVCRLLHSINPKAYGIDKIELNLSVVQCMDSEVVDNILRIKNFYKVPNNLLNLEITETAAAYQQRTLLETMQKLKKEGLEFSLDDYGSGNATMEYLIDLPFDIVKIDKELVWNAYSNPSTNIALASTIAMITDLGKSVLAEGVETQEQAEWLTAMGCDYLQGYYYSRPMPKDTFLEYMKEQNYEKIKDEIYNSEELDEIEELEVIEDEI